MSEGALWSVLVTSIDPDNTKNMSAVLQSTITLLETELAKARAALQEIQPNAGSTPTRGEDLAVGAMAAYRQNLIGSAPDFFYGARRLTPKELGLVPAVREVELADKEGNVNEQPEPTVDGASPKGASVEDLLANNLILDHMAPYLTTGSLLSLSATSRYFRSLILETPYVFRQLNLTTCRGAQLADQSPIDTGGQTWRSERMDESLTEDEFYSGPLRGIFASLERQSILQGVRTLILDGLSVPADLVSEIIRSDRFNINLLSIRDCRHLNERKLMQVLNYAVRPSRPAGTPRVKGIYYFTSMDRPRAAVRSRYRDWWSSLCVGQRAPGDTTPSAGNPWGEHRQNAWYKPSGKLLKRHIEDGWAQTLRKCEGIIAFDAVLCRGPRHNVNLLPQEGLSPEESQSGNRLLGPAIATIALGPRGCDGCHTSPEGPAIWGQSPDAHFPLLTPPPFHSSTPVSARRPAVFLDEYPVLIARCADCLTDRWCHRCNKWFCDTCLPHPEHVRSNLSPHQTAVRGPRTGNEILGPGCASCKLDCQRTCQKCQGDYCIDHNEGCSSTMTPKLPGDKIVLPQSALEQLLAAAPLREVSSQGPSRPYTNTFDPFNPHTFAAEYDARERGLNRQQQLPHPLTFRIVNPRNGRVIYAGIREFSARDNEVGLSASLREALDIEDAQLPSEVDGADRAGGDFPVLAVHARQLPKGTYDWKALLERHLRDNYTTLTNGSFRFLLDKVEPEGEGICVVDTDLEVDIVALSEDQARETLRRRLAKTSRVPAAKGGSSVGGVLELGAEVTGQVLPGEYVDYELQKWENGNTTEIYVMSDDDVDISLLVSPLSGRQRSRPRKDEFIRIAPTNVELEGAEALYISVHAFAPPEELAQGASQQLVPLAYRLYIVSGDPAADARASTAHNPEAHGPDDIQCKNCQRWVSQRTFVLHENFCFRNNILCAQCNNVFQKRSPEWQNHWHCSHDSSHGNDPAGKQKHDFIFHSKHSCRSCGFEAEGLQHLAQHRTTFCHLVVPQQGESDPDVHDPEVLLSGLTPHELVDGGRTTECHLCNKIVRLRDMKTHLRHHDLNRLSRPMPQICLNQNCGRTLDGRGLQTAIKPGTDTLGLCSICFGPLYVDTYDPEGKALRRRIERRYLSQMMGGCGKSWCQNEYCKTGKQNRQSSNNPASLSAAAILSLVRPLIDAVDLQRKGAHRAPFYFCADQAGQQRRVLAEMIAAKDIGASGSKAYELPWCVAAVEAAGGVLEKAREWLENWAPSRGERPAGL
ncbi:putative ubiquitin fusion degradation protein (Ufd1) [Aspergillus lucknowensis]|uniref:Ubiquitin-protein ligase E3A N-terminal zinc-binding domain-containing protein n=1 Tax=Aspergillus lucknowensis TaxID=176173 RepID=A0ABR4LQM4_9EURO